MTAFAEGPTGGILEVAAQQATARSPRGVVLAAAPLAAARGADVMRQGGNAYDAVVTAALVETVVLPSKCGIAGDVVAICLSPGNARPQALLAIGPAAQELEQAALDGRMTVTGPMSVGVPGAPAGYSALAARGRLPLDRLVAPAIEIATDGFAWAPINHLLSVESQALVEANNPGPNRFFPGGRPIAPHSVVRLPGLAKLLAQYATRGAALFHSATGEAVARYVSARGGVLRPEDLTRPQAEWSECPSVEIHGRRVWATPAPTHGPALLEAMSGHPGGPTAGVVWDRVQAALGVRAQLHDRSGTSIVSAADDEGNVVVVIHSNSYPTFGSGLVVAEFDLILNNRAGRGFSPVPKHPNFPRPGRRPATTLHAWAASDRSGHPAFLGGTPGGENQMPWNAQLLAQLLDGEDDPGNLVVAPRWELGTEGTAAVEEGLDQNAVAELEARAGPVRTVRRWGLRTAYQVISVPRAGEATVGAVDPRSGGAAIPV